MITIETERLLLRPPDARDIEAVIDFYVSERSALAGGHVPFADAVTRAYAIFGHWIHRGYGMFAITRKGEDTVIGMTGPLYPPGRPETEVGWSLFDGAEGQGYATEAARAAIDHARNVLQWPEIVHYILPDNVRSVRVAERLGARLDPSAPQPRPDLPCLVYRQAK